jgi:DNA-binding transcriptional regulator YiaG
MNNHNTHTAAEVEPDLADRLAKSLRVSGISVGEMAAFLEVHRNTVSAWLNGRAHPNPANMRLWAMKTELPYEWIRHGEWPGEVSAQRKARRRT